MFTLPIAHSLLTASKKYSQFVGFRLELRCNLQCTTVGCIRLCMDHIDLQPVLHFAIVVVGADSPVFATYYFHTIIEHVIYLYMAVGIPGTC